MPQESLTLEELKRIARRLLVLDMTKCPHCSVWHHAKEYHICG